MVVEEDMEDEGGGGERARRSKKRDIENGKKNGGRSYINGRWE